MDYKFVKPDTYIRPKTITYSSGMIAIESDDGNIGDYTHWFPLAKRVSKKHNQFWPNQTVKICPDVNTAYINHEDKMTVEQLQELVSFGWEINSHGKHHVGIGKHNVVENVIAGDTKIKISLPEYIGYNAQYTNYTFKILDSTNEETFIVTSRDDGSEGYIYLDRQVVNSYNASDSFVSITEESCVDLLQGAVNDLAGWGIATTHHVYTYHSGVMHNYNAETISIVSEVFDSARGEWGAINYADSLNLYELKSQLFRDESYLSKTEIDTILTDTQNNNGFTIFYGHGGTDEGRLEILEYILDKALSMGIKVVTISEGVKLLQETPS